MLNPSILHDIQDNNSLLVTFSWRLFPNHQSIAAQSETNRRQDWLQVQASIPATWKSWLGE
jgi:hypothetical protein